jgi:hypothetical protein
VSDELVLIREVQARRALRKHPLRLRVLAPAGAWIGCGTLRVLRVKFGEDGQADIAAGYESYRPA